MAAKEDAGFALFSWGANSYGQLGLGNTEDKLVPCKVLLEGSQSKSLKQISGGGGHTVLLKTDGTILVFGWNKNGQCGITSPGATSTSPPDLLVPQPLPHQPWRVTKVACGWNHTLALTQDGTVMAWGSNAFGQLGLPSVDKQSETPLPLSREAFQGDHVADISAGLRHSLATTVGGDLFAWGDGKKGQLGLGVKELDTPRCPRCVSSFLPSPATNCLKVCAGAYHSTAITADLSLLSWGLNRHGQCGVTSTSDSLQQRGEQNFKCDSSGHITNVCVPVRVVGMAPVAEVYCGWSHTLVVTEGDRRVYGWGRGDYGQLGRTLKLSGQGMVQGKPTDQSGQRVVQEETMDQSGQAWTPFPEEIKGLKHVRQVACGSEHNIGITASGEVVSFGWNEHGMCATGGTEDVIDMVTRVSGLPSYDEGSHMIVGAGAGHSLALIKLNHHD